MFNSLHILLYVIFIWAAAFFTVQSAHSLGHLADARLSERQAKDYWRKLNPTCAVCGAKSNISNGNKNDVHHILPVSVRPDLAADTNNLVTLCRRHHFWVGHAGNWRTYNTNLVNSIKALKEAAKQIER